MLTRNGISSLLTNPKVNGYPLYELVSRGVFDSSRTDASLNHRESSDNMMLRQVAESQDQSLKF
jgi:hypothetical protein